MGRDGTIHQFSGGAGRSAQQLSAEIPAKWAVDAAKFTFTPPQGVTVDDQRK
ncbi:hypothetical protein [Escherichia coli]|uniref:hypothetical protein n=1 Tax=Escherichia coli TaxID=562 RepID=UPI00336BE42C